MSRRRSNVARLGTPDPVLVSYAGSNAAAPFISYIVCINGRVPERYEVLCIKSNFLLSLMKILFGALSMIHEDAVFLLSVVKASTVVSSLSAIRTSLRTVLRTLSPPKISSCIPGENIRLWLGLLAPTIIVVHMCRLRVSKSSTKGVNMSVYASFLSNGKESPFRDIWLWFVMRWVMTSLWIVPFRLSIML